MRQSHNKDDFSVYPANELMDAEITVNGEYVDCVQRAYVFRKERGLFQPQKTGVLKTNAITLLTCDEIVKLLDDGLIAVELILRDDEDIIVTLCFNL